MTAEGVQELRSENEHCTLISGRQESSAKATFGKRNKKVVENDLLLHEAVIKNEPDNVQKILKEQVDVNSRNNYGRAPIHWASSKGSTDIIEMLIKAKCDVEAEDKSGMTPLLMAAWHGHRDAVQLLIDSGAAATAVNKRQYTLLICAAKNNRIDVIDYLVEFLKNVKMDGVDAENKTALHHAAAAGHAQTVRKLVDMGATIDCLDASERTPLHVAAEKGHVEVVEFLLKNNADLYASDKQGNTPLHLSTENKQTRVVQILLTFGNDPDLANAEGLTALHIASDLGCRGIVELLLGCDANVNSRTKNGDTPLHLACRSSKSEIARVLIARKADVNIANLRLETPIHVAAGNAYSEICENLLAAGAKIEQKGQENKTTPLCVAARGRFSDVVGTMMKTAGINYLPSEQEGTGKTKSILRKADDRKKRRGNKKSDDSQNEELRNLFHKIAYRDLSKDDWKKLAVYWALTEEQISAVEHRVSGSSTYRERGFQTMLIWARGLAPGIDPIKELHESLLAVGKEKAADNLRKNMGKENCGGCKSERMNFWSCLIL